MVQSSGFATEAVLKPFSQREGVLQVAATLLVIDADPCTSTSLPPTYLQDRVFRFQMYRIFEIHASVVECTNRFHMVYIQ